MHTDIGTQFLYVAIACGGLFLAVLGYAAIADGIAARKRRP